MNQITIRTIDATNDHNEEDDRLTGITVAVVGEALPAALALIHWTADPDDPAGVESDAHALTAGQARELAQALIEAAHVIDNKTMTLSAYEPTPADLATLALAFDAAERAGLGTCIGPGFRAHDGKHDEAAAFIETWLTEGHDAD